MRSLQRRVVSGGHGHEGGVWVRGTREPRYGCPRRSIGLGSFLSFLERFIPCFYLNSCNVSSILPLLALLDQYLETRNAFLPDVYFGAVYLRDRLLGIGGLDRLSMDAWDQVHGANA